MSNLYIRVMTGFYVNRKTIRLRSKLGNDAYWIPPRLWAYAAEHQADGDFSNYTSEELAELLGCSKHCLIMLQALKECGFIDESGAIHDWELHNGYHQKFSERAKKAAAARWSKTKTPPTPPKTLKVEMESGDKHCSSNATSILLFLNQKSGRGFRITETNLGFIEARLSESGVDVDGCKKMIERQCAKWLGTEQSEYLRPETLFNKTKFDSYYSAKNLPIQNENHRSNPPQRVDRSIGTANEGVAKQYAGLKSSRVGDVSEF